MKRKILGLFLSFALMVSLLTISATAVTVNYNSYTPTELKATLMTVDDLHPFGSALLSFKIANLPRDTATQHWQVVIEKMIGDGDWRGVSSEDTSTYLDSYAVGGGTYHFEQLWNESDFWDGTMLISYRVYVILNDETWSIVGRSGYSNVASIMLQASSWAQREVIEAMDLGLVPESLRTKDLTKPITREEFCELAVLLYEKSTNTIPLPVSPNPFGDTTNEEILRAYALGITKGTTTTTFSPNSLVTRQECATFLFRTIKAIKQEPDSYYTDDINAAPVFLDQKDIGVWASDAVKYMASLGIIKGSDNKFSPLGQATREQAILMSVRTYNIFG